MHDHGFHALTVAEVVAETDQAVSLAFDVPAELRDAFAYTPGQFLNVRRLVGGKTRQRCYSLCSSPQVGEPLRIAIKRVEGGLVSNDLCGGVQAGDVIEVQPPAGHFTPAALDGDFLLIAGGSGVTPVLSILKSALAVGTGKIALVYANRDDRSIIFGETIAELARRHPGRLIVLHWLESVQGLPRPDLLAELMRPWANAEVFICGPEPFMVSATEALTAIGVPEARVHLERFVSLPDEDDIVAPEASGEEASLQVAIDGETRDLAWPSGTKLLDTMLAAGIDAPYSCRVGGCSACMCRVTSGEVRMAINLVLDDAEIAEGWVLACQAYAGTPSVAIEIS